MGKRSDSVSLLKSPKAIDAKGMPSGAPTLNLTRFISVDYGAEEYTICANDNCKRKFIKDRINQVGCSRKCSNCRADKVRRNKKIIAEQVELDKVRYGKGDK